MKRRVLVVSDIHSNQTALEAVLKDAEQHGPFDARLCAGYIVGYGPSPNEVVDMLRAHGFISVLGNHDKALLTGDVDRMNAAATREALQKNKKELTPVNMKYIRG